MDRHAFRQLPPFFFLSLYKLSEQEEQGKKQKATLEKKRFHFCLSFFIGLQIINFSFLNYKILGILILHNVEDPENRTSS